jgi:hypothetical protein
MSPCCDPPFFVIRYPSLRAATGRRGFHVAGGEVADRERLKIGETVATGGAGGLDVAPLSKAHAAL